MVDFCYKTVSFNPFFMSLNAKRPDTEDKTSHSCGWKCCIEKQSFEGQEKSLLRTEKF